MTEFSLGLIIGGFLGILSCLLLLNIYLLWKHLTQQNQRTEKGAQTAKLDNKVAVKKKTVPLPNGLAMTSGSISTSKKGSDP